MYKHILAATDGSELATKAVAHAAALAKTLGAKLTVVAVTDPWPVLEIAQKAQERKRDPIGDYEKHAADWAHNVLSGAEKVVASAGASCTQLHVVDKHPAQGILDAANENGCDVIVISTHGRRGIRRMVLGSQASDIVAEAKVPIIVVK